MVWHAGYRQSTKQKDYGEDLNQAWACIKKYEKLAEVSEQLSMYHRVL